jgi:uncharacterized protein YndB with AHSA1/START domain
MTGPQGERYHGAWRAISAEEPHRLECEDYFAEEDGSENPDLPKVRTVVSIDGAGATRRSIESRLASPEAMAQVLEMRMEGEITQALGRPMRCSPNNPPECTDALRRWRT